MDPTTSLLVCILLSYIACVTPILSKSNGDPDNSSIISDIAAMEQKIKSLQADLKSAQTEITRLTNELQSCPSVKVFSHLRSDVENLQSENRNTKQQISNTDVAFQVSLGTESAISSWTTLKFNDINYNAGNGYNGTTGIFTAPVPGTYLFWASVDFDEEVTNYIYIYKGQEILAKAFTRPLREASVGDSRSISVTAVAYLATGDQAHFQADVGGTGGPSGSIYGYNLSRYGGVLLNGI